MPNPITLTLPRDALLPVLARTTSVIAGRTTIPILSNLLMQVEDGVLHLTGTDLDISIQASVDAVTHGLEGRITAPGGMLHDIVRKLPKGADVSLHHEGSRLIVKAGRSRFTLYALPAEDFPEVPEPEAPHRFTLPRKTLEALLARVNFAVSAEGTRYYLNGIFWHVLDGDLVSVATDGYRLALMRTPAPEGAEGMPGIIIPRKTVGELLKLMKAEREETVGIEISLAKARFEFGRMHLVSKLIDGTFPEYQRVIPQRNDKVATAGREDLIRAADRVSTISSERGRGIRLSFTGEALELSVTNPDAGSSSEEVEIRFSGPDMEIGFNAKYLADALGALEGDVAKIALADSGSPALITGTLAKEPFLTVLMPMRV